MLSPLPTVMATHDGVTRTVLANGLTVLIEPMHHAPVVALQAWVQVGGADEDKAHEAGLAHLHEHMLFKGTKKRAVGQVARDVEAAGGEINAWTSFDETVYHLVLGSDACDLGLDLLADVLQHSTFDSQELAKEIEVVLEEIRRAQDNPARRAMMALFALAYEQHPYKDPVLGTAKSVAATTQERMLAFFHGHYRPDNTTLIVTGDITVDDAIKKVERHFGHWRPNHAAISVASKALRAKEPMHQEVKACVLAEDVQEARITIAWQGVAATSASTPALDLFAILLGQGDTSILHRQLVRPRIVQDAYASSYTPKDPGLFFMGATLQSPRPTAEQVTEAVSSLTQTLMRVARGGFTQSELETARTKVLSDEAFSRQTMEGQARKRGFYVSVAQDYLFERQYVSGITQASHKDVMEAATSILRGSAHVVLQLPKDSPQDAQKLGPKDFAKIIEAATNKDHGALLKKGGKNFSRHGVHVIKLAEGPTLLVQKERSSVTAARAINLGGLRYESADKGGLALLMSNSIGQCTSELDAHQLARKVANFGGHMGGFAGRNTVGLSGEWLSLHDDGALELFLQALLQPRFAAEDVLRERHALAERLRAREDSPGGVAMDLFLAKLYPTHPYGFSAMGSMDSLSRLHAEDVAAYCERVIDVGSMVLSVVGPMDVDAVVGGVEAQLQKLGARNQAGVHSSPPKDAPPSLPQSVVRPLAKQQAHVIIGSMGLTFDHEDRYAMEVMCAVLSGQSGRLFADLRDKQSLAYALSCSSTEGLEPGHVLVHMACGFDKVPMACAGVRKHLHDLTRTAIEGWELTRAQQMLIGSHAIDLQRPGARAMTYATQEIYNLGFDHHHKSKDRILAVTADDVMRVAATHLHSGRLLQVVVGPGDDAGAA